MKTFSNKIVAVLFFSLIGSSLFCKGWSVPYRISSSKKDSTLNKTEACFIFKFFDSNGGKTVQADIKMSYNGINVTAKKDENGLSKNANFSIKIKPGKYLFRFFYDKDHEEMVTDSISIDPSHKSVLEVTFQSSKVPVYCFKPVIYIYPKETTEVNIKLQLKRKLTFTYPEYNSGWKFTADPDGTIAIGNKKFNYLFWEGETDIDANKINSNEGFIVEKNNLIKFFEEKLSEMRLNSKESADFITYWCPLMNTNEKNYVHFIFNEEFDQYAPLTIAPKPDNIFRVFMIWSKADEKINEKVVEQKIPALDRKGFTVVEWGGTNLEKLNTLTSQNQ